MRMNFKKYISIVLVMCLVIALVSLVACKDEKEPKETTPAATTPADTVPNTTTPKETTPATPDETVTFPSDGETDPKQEDVFFE